MAYPARDALLIAEVFPGLTMKNHVFTGRDTIEKDVGNASLIPTYSDFKSRHGVQSHFRNWHFSTIFPEIGIPNIPEKTRS